MEKKEMSSECRRIHYQDLLSLITGTLVSCGVPPSNAAIEAEVMAEADLFGTPSHGVRMLPNLVIALRKGKVSADPRLIVRRDCKAVCVMDGDHGPGRYVCIKAMEQAVARARQFGIGACLSTRTSHWGRAHAYAYRAARSGMIGICMTNAVAGMIAFGSDRVRLGNNPLAIGVPRGNGLDPVVLDIAMSQAAVGKIVTYHRTGRRVPLDWGLDRNGRPTDDPAEILASRNFLPMGGHKGFGLALMIEMLTSVLAGGLLCQELAASDQANVDIDSSKLFLAMDIAAFGEPAHYFQRVEDMLAYIQSSSTEDAPVLYPGQNGWKTRDIFLVKGIPMEAQTIADLAQEGIAVP